MNFQPIVPFGGNAGWAFLNRTRETQQAAFSATATVVRETEYFTSKIGQIETADQLVNDRTLLKVALGAFGLDADINNKFFLKKILEDGTLKTDSLANKLSDKRYRDFSKAFGFGDFSVPRTVLSDFPAEIIDRYNTLQFEASVGEQSEEIRLALSLERELTGVAGTTASNDAKWFTIMGTPPLRSVFETALGLPTSFGALDIDKQLVVFKNRAQRTFGTDDVSQLAAPDKIGEVNRLFLARSELKGLTTQTVPGSAALTLLQSASLSNSFLRL